jgi:hypothetical protein
MNKKNLCKFTDANVKQPLWEKVGGFSKKLKV